tara:strand:+ start:577 stop:1659 length:1083 start_codon:yes stop_codon:yes gene_type:complete
MTIPINGAQGTSILRDDTPTDIIAVPTNPLEDISVMLDIEFVMARGVEQYFRGHQMENEILNKITEQVARTDQKVIHMTSKQEDQKTTLDELVEFKNKIGKLIYASLAVVGLLGLTGFTLLGVSSCALEKSNSAQSNATKSLNDANGAQTIINETITKSKKLMSDLEGATKQHGLDSFKTGMIVAWYSPKAPDGWFLCDGKEPRNQIKYPELFKILDEATGLKKTKESFYTPDLSGKFLRGVSVDKLAGETVDAQVGSHSHFLFGSRGNNNSGYAGKSLAADGLENSIVAYMGGTTSDGLYQMRTASDATTRLGRSHNNQNDVEGNWPDHVTVYFIIKHDTLKSAKTENSSTTIPFTETD